MADVPYEALGVSPEMADHVDSPDLSPTGLSSIVAGTILRRLHDSQLVDALRDLAFDTPNQQGISDAELGEYEKAVLARYCGALARRLGLRIVPEGQDG